MIVAQREGDRLKKTRVDFFYNLPFLLAEQLIKIQ